VASDIMTVLNVKVINIIEDRVTGDHKNFVRLSTPERCRFNFAPFLVAIGSSGSHSCVTRSLIHLISRSDQHIFPHGGYVFFANPVATKPPLDFGALGALTLEEPVQLGIILVAVDRETVSSVVALVNLRDIHAMTERAVEQPSERVALGAVVAVVLLQLLGVGWGTVRRTKVGTVEELYLGTVLSSRGVYLGAKARSLC
jgi:hypothetical protein